MEHDPNRRMLITALAGLTLANVSLASASTGNANVQSKSHVLVAYFSRSLNTDLFEIEPATPYPEDYFQTVEQAKNERERGVKPALKNSVADISRYEAVYLGFPIWATSVPPVVQTFLSSHNLAGKLLIPFITHGGYGKGDSDDILASLAPTARREKPLVIECDQERRTTETVTSWLETIRS
ncbi:flavodoxin [Pectobacterium brasiliense]|uniref:flavodoxin n=1 Tax=Pectobacterium brasiliense TaxID=180957 RepID=UPI0015DE16D4|nr:flavodoxin [Pectobacterium brasiliense]MBA0207736.1 flavodoxin [Pectobacterium brasiliense]